MAATKRTPEIEQAIVESVRNGAYAKHAAIAVGISERALYEWIETDARFASAVHRARAEAKNAMVKILHGAAVDDWRAAERYLARVGDGEFIEKTATEVTGTLTMAGLAQIIAGGAQS